MIENPLGKAVTLCALCGQEAEVFTLHGMPIMSCSCVSARDGAVAICWAPFADVPREATPALLSRATDVRAALGDFSGERQLYATTMSDTPLGQRSMHTVSVVETRGHAPMTPTISEADRRKRARAAYDRAKGTTPAVETWTCGVCGASNISPGCKTCEAFDEQIVERTVEKLVARTPVVRSGVDPTERLVDLGIDPIVVRHGETFIDGMDLNLIQRRFALRGREDVITSADGELLRGNATLTPDQEQAARNLWAMELWKRRLEAERKERERVVVDLDW